VRESGILGPSRAKAREAVRHEKPTNQRVLAACDRPRRSRPLVTDAAWVQRLRTAADVEAALRAGDLRSTAFAMG